MTQCNHTTNQRTFKHLSAIQRGKLFQMVQEKKYTQTQMAQMLGVNQSTISRELKRGRVQQRNTNLEYYTVYLPDYAQIRYQQNRQKYRIAPGIGKYDPLFWKELTFELKKKPDVKYFFGYYATAPFIKIILDILPVCLTGGISTKLSPFARF